MKEIELSNVSDDDLFEWFLDTPLDEIEQFIQVLNEEQFKFLFDKLKMINQRVDHELSRSEEPTINEEVEVADFETPYGGDDEPSEELSDSFEKINKVMEIFFIVE